jgi:deoxyribonuclease V
MRIIMSFLYHHAIPNTLVQKAEYVQERLRNRCSLDKVIETDDISLIAGADAAYSGDTVIAAVVVMTYPNLVKVCDSVAHIKTRFPYIPGLFVFREGPGLLKAFHTLDCKPDLIILNGHGYAHPRRFGIACHIGLILGVPSIGVANHPLMNPLKNVDPSPRFNMRMNVLEWQCVPWIHEGQSTFQQAI